MDEGLGSHLDTCIHHDVRSCIAVRATKPVIAIAGIPEEAWVGIDRTDCGAADITSTTPAGRPFIVGRTRLSAWAHLPDSPSAAPPAQQQGGPSLRVPWSALARDP